MKQLYFIIRHLHLLKKSDNISHIATTYPPQVINQTVNSTVVFYPVLNSKIEILNECDFVLFLYPANDYFHHLLVSL